MKANRKGKLFVHSNLCSTDFSVASSGIHEVVQHIGNMKYSELEKQSADQVRLTAVTLEGIN